MCITTIYNFQFYSLRCGEYLTKYAKELICDYRVRYQFLEIVLYLN
jgi:hypothetical protein